MKQSGWLLLFVTRGHHGAIWLPDSGFIDPRERLSCSDDWRAGQLHPLSIIVAFHVSPAVSMSSCERNTSDR